MDQDGNQPGPSDNQPVDQPSTFAGTTVVPAPPVGDVGSEMEIDLTQDENEASTALSDADNILRDVDLALNSAPNSPVSSPVIQLDEGNF
jgi:hypothetical protein